MEPFIPLLALISAIILAIPFYYMLGVSVDKET